MRDLYQFVSDLSVRKIERLKANVGRPTENLVRKVASTEYKLFLGPALFLEFFYSFSPFGAAVIIYSFFGF